nr:B3 domain-containing protein REM14-like isoform X1 [Ipomoea batatas]
MVEPIARDTTSTSPADHPYFVSTIKLYCLKAQRLYLPMEFARSNGLVTEEKREMILRDDKERSWPVVLGRVGDQFCLLEGWQEFRMANGLKEGDAYKFEMIKTGKTPIAKFHLLDTTSSSAENPHFVATIKPYCLRISQLDLPLGFARSNGLVAEEKREMVLRDDTERSWPVVLGTRGKHAALLQGWQAFQMAKGLKEGDAYKFELIKAGKKPIAKFHLLGTTSSLSAENPHFVATIKPYCLRKPQLYLPIEFAKSNGLVAKEKREMILRDDKERSWPVVLGRMGRHVALMRGWQAFQMAKGLKEGDAYKFELIQSGKKPIAKFHCHFSGEED